MDISHIHTLRSAFTPAHIQLACDGVFLALPLTRTTVGVWSLQDISCRPLELEGHRKILTSLSLGNGPSPKLLCSAADDYVIVWNLTLARQQVEKSETVRGKVVWKSPDPIQYTAFSNNDRLIAVCCGYEVIILQSKIQEVVASLEGHTCPVTCAEFCPHYSATLVTISEDRTYKVWNLQDYTLVYQSPIITASPFISLTMSLQQPHVAIGSADGQVRIYDLTDGNGFRCLRHIDVAKIIHKIKEEKRIAKLTDSPRQGPVKISSRPSWKQGNKSSSVSEELDPVEDSVEAGYGVLGLYFTYQPLEGTDRLNSAATKPVFLQHKDAVVKDLLKTAPMLLVGTTAGLLQVNARTLEVCSFVDLQEPVVSDQGLQADTKILNAAGSVYFNQGKNVDQFWCIVGSPFQNVVHVLQWNHALSTSPRPGPATHTTLGNTLHEGIVQQELSALLFGGGDSIDQNDDVKKLTVLSHQPLNPDSPLRAELVPKQKEAGKPLGPKGFLNTPQKGKILDKQPITFKTKIKSSGYTEAPRMTMFKPKTDFSKTKSDLPRRGSKSSLSSTSSDKSVDKAYPMGCDPPTVLQSKLDVAERPTAVNMISVSDDGQQVACALANKTAHCFKLPLTGKGNTFSGHNHIVSSVSWSHDGNWLITASDDKTASIWSRSQSDPVLTLNTVNHNFTIADKDGQKKDNKVFPKEVHHAQFYYMDKFILLSCGNTLYLYKFHLDPTKLDIKRYLSQSKYKLVQSWSTEAQHITALSSINSFYSYIVLCAGSSKHVHIYDMNVGRKVGQLADVHSRNVHAICQNEGSPYVSHPPNAYDLFATAASGDCIKLWDLRTNKCVRRCEGHMNRVHPCGLDLSPCGRYIATGSEDRSAYIFDVRSGTYCEKLSGHTDVVTDVAFHPLYPQMITASLDGKLRLYTDR